MTNEIMEVLSECLSVCVCVCETSTQKDLMHRQELNNKVIEERQMHLEDRED